jgi:hypothetical protein
MGHQRRARAHARRDSGSFSAGVAAPHNNDVEGLIEHRDDLTADFAARNTGRWAPGQKRAIAESFPLLR